MNKIKCLITGGHKYASENLIMTEDLPRNLFIFRNFCVKCHKYYTVEIPRVNMFSEAFMNNVKHEIIKKENETGVEECHETKL
ncbi:MAG: hypothetical protein IK122_02660 [Alphaproteobacteria bacterium]|nr:hypothetical protein [Alphaproteobacteria bacterium]